MYLSKSTQLGPCKDWKKMEDPCVCQLHHIHETRHNTCHLQLKNDRLHHDDNNMILTTFNNG